MEVNAITTHVIMPFENIDKILNQYLSNLNEGCIVAITSKIISICEGRIVDKNTISKKELIKQEADKLLVSKSTPFDVTITIKNDKLMLSAGIDESNANETYILHPLNSQQTAEQCWLALRKINNIKNLGVIITDSSTTVMRKGLTGVALGWCGFEPLRSYLGRPDIFGRNLQVSEVNILDSLASCAVFVMGEGNETSPIAVIKNIPKINFLDRAPNKKEIDSITITLKNDIYAPILDSTKWI